MRRNTSDIRDSAGIIVFRQYNDSMEVLRIVTRKGGRSFPKGHIEEGETPRQAAIREVLEETGIKAAILEGFSCVVPSAFGDEKRNVIYYAGMYEGGALQPQEEEVCGAEWTAIEKADENIRFEQDRDAFYKARDYVLSL